MTSTKSTPRRAQRALALKTILLLTAALAVVGGLAAAMTLRDSGGSSSSAELYTVRETSFDMLIPSSGELEALNSIELRSKVERQTVIKWIIDEGVIVEEGDLLVELNSDEISERLEEEVLAVEAARSELVTALEAVELQKNENNSTLSNALLTLEIAELELQRWQEGEVATRRLDLELGIERAESNLAQAIRDLENCQELYKEEFISLLELEDAKLARKEAENELKKANLAQTTYEQFEYPKAYKTKTSDVTEAEAELSRVKTRNASNLSQREAALANREKALKIREERVADLEEQLAACRITAPSGGLVVYSTSMNSGRRWNDDGPLQIGQEVYPNQLLIVLPDVSQIVATVKVHETQSSLISPGQKAEVRIDAMPDLRLQGTVRSVGVMAEQNWGTQVREYTIRILLDGANNWDLKPSMRCKANIKLGTVTNVLAVPVQAVFAENRQYFVWTPAGDKFDRTHVQIGRSSEMMIEVTEGLAEGDVVLLRQPGPGEVAPGSESRPQGRPDEVPPPGDDEAPAELLQTDATADDATPSDSPVKVASESQPETQEAATPVEAAETPPPAPQGN